MRTWGARGLVAVGLVLVLVALVAGYLQRNVFDADRFGDHAVAALRTDAVRSSLATSVTDRIVAGRPRLIAARPLIESAVSEALRSRVAGGLVSRAAADVHNAVFSADKGSILIDLANLRVVVSAVLEATSPDLAGRVLGFDDEITVKLADRTLTADLVRLADRVAFLAWLAPVVALGCLAGSLLLARRRRRAALGIGLGILIVAALAFVGLVLAGGVVVGGATGSRRDVVAAVFDSYVGGFALWCLVLGSAGTLIAASAAAMIGPVDPTAIPRRAWAIATHEPHRPGWRLARALAIGAVGLFCIVESAAALTLVATVAGGYLVFLALARILALIVGDTAAPEPLPTASAARRRAVPVVLGSVAAVAVACLAVVLATNGSDQGEARASIVAGTGCNGHDELCDRRLDQVVLPSTHNSNTAAAAGFLNANHALTMTGQLDLGARGLLIDALAGQRNENGVVRTDLAGKTEDIVVAEIGEEGLAAAQRLAGSVAFGPIEGAKGTYLCHVLCELGAQPMADGLREIAAWLRRHPREVLVIFIQDEIPPPPIKEAFREAGMLDLVSEYEPGTPFPTLRQMIDSGRRVFVMAENQGEPTGWYHQGFVLTQDTPFSFRRPADLELPSSCDLNRGKPDSPLFLLNHWVETYPPNPLNADVVNRKDFILERARRCEKARGRLPNLVAVDFAERGDFVGAADVLNGVGGD